MSKKPFIHLLILCTLLYINNVYAQEYTNNVDTILQRMNISAKYYETNTPNFEAEMYIKGNLDVQKRNIFLKMIPYLWKIDKDQDQYFIELSSNFSHTYPNIYNQTFHAINASHPGIKKYIETTVLPYLQGNVYSSYLYGNLYSPISRKGKKYYNYFIESRWDHAGITYYKINFSPKLKSYQLVSGDMIINSNNWSIRSLFINGKTEFLTFSNYIEMGEIGSSWEFLTKSSNLKIDFKLLGNHLSGEYYTYMNYLKTSQPEPENSKRKGKYDLTLLYNANYNNDALEKNLNFDTIRPTPLTPREKKIVQQSNIKKDSLSKDTVSSSMQALINVGNFLITDYSLNMNKFGSISFSPIISPILFNYSSSDGIAYAQKLNYNKIFKGDRLFSIEPKIGYNFKYKEFYWWVKSNFDYSPKNGASILIDLGDGNKVGTDRIQEDLHDLPDTIFNYDKIHLNNFRHAYFKVGHKIEVANGFNVSAILAMHKYIEVDKSDLSVINYNSAYIKQARDIAKHTYTSFVPEIQLNWTPHQYYYMEGKRKVYLYSKYPSFSLNWAYAIKGVFNNSATYHRVEFDMQHKIKLGLTQSLCYRFGIGGFFNYSNLYFADFLNFRRNNLPVGWDDEIGGTFQLLSSFKYNEIDRYVRGHIKYDAPFLLVPTLFRKLPYIMRERIYCNMLFVKTLKPYVELGYGIGTNLFNVGIFIGGEVNKFDLVGFKFTFELFNH